jgi:hypothetical protein
MRTPWSLRLKLLLLPIVGLFAMEYRCGGGEPPDETPPDGRSFFNPEYDYMEGYDVFPRVTRTLRTLLIHVARTSYRSTTRK